MTLLTWNLLEETQPLVYVIEAYGWLSACAVVPLDRPS